MQTKPQTASPQPASYSLHGCSPRAAYMLACLNCRRVADRLRITDRGNLDRARATAEVIIGAGC